MFLARHGAQLLLNFANAFVFDGIDQPRQFRPAPGGALGIEFDAGLAYLQGRNGVDCLPGTSIERGIGTATGYRTKAKEGEYKTQQNSHPGGDFTAQKSGFCRTFPEKINPVAGMAIRGAGASACARGGCASGKNNF